MRYDRARTAVAALLAAADVNIGGGRPWDIEVHDERFYRRLLLEGSVGAGEAYMDGWWDCPRIDELFHRVMRTGLDVRVARRRWLESLTATVVNRQRRSRAFRVGQRHYDIGNDLFEVMLDPRMMYSCGYWHRAESLEAAQAAKLELVCRKLGLLPGMRVLDIGCGWGGAARYAARRFGVSVTGVTVSHEQAEYARDYCRGLPVEIRLSDYREVTGSFDRIFSLGMFEHVGYKNYHRFMGVVRDRLEPDGLFLLHTIAGNESVRTTDPWIRRYIFPGSMLPSPRQIAAAVEGLFVLEDWHNFGADYDKTLMQWYRNLRQGWPRLAARYSEQFRRMWSYYLLMSAGAFRARANQLWQIVASPGGVAGGYHVER